MRKYIPLVAILTHSKVNETVYRHWPHYLASGADILMVGRENTDCSWPDMAINLPGLRHPSGYQRIYGMKSGIESGAIGDNHIKRFIHVLDTFMYAHDYRNHTHLVMTEYDAIFPREIDRSALEHEDCLVTYLCGHHTPDNQFFGSRFFHTPWMMSREMGYRILKRANAMLRAGLIERGYVDRFLGLLADLHDIPVHVPNTFSANTLDTPVIMEAAKKAVAGGAWHVHGVKTSGQLKELLTAFPNVPTNEPVHES